MLISILQSTKRKTILHKRFKRTIILKGLIMILEQKDRDLFIQWLTNEIESNKMLINQMEKIKVPETIIENYKIETSCAIIILKKLQNTETL